MNNILIAYGSTTGNTEITAEQIAEQLQDQEGQAVKIQDIVDTDIKDLKAADVLILGASTWDDGVLQADFQEFIDNIDDVDLSDKKIAIFGLGDSSYPKFCVSADILEEAFTNFGGELLVDNLKIDGFPDEEENQQKVEEWCQEIKAEL